MCIVCIEWEAGKLTNAEALKNLGEMISGVDGDYTHHFEAYSKILDKEVPLNDTDEELDQKWHEETHDGED